MNIRKAMEGDYLRKLILQMQMSIDGLEAVNDPKIKWQLWDWGPKCPWDQTLKDDFNTIFESVDAILLSRLMVKAGYIDHWTEASKLYPENPLFKFATRVVAAQKIVVTSKSIKNIWERTTVVGDDLSKEVAKLKQKNGSDIISFGGVRFASALLTERLVDELQLFINPAIMGTGKSIFKKGLEGTSLKLLHSRQYECGMVVNRYSPKTIRRAKGH
jgi:dihydrofolate reductase